ncbi:MAG: hypothetical protein HYX35_02315, partial [Proteobacteria bacterium]|nr:hypothetical protein [Pseudomonadota bacterium]
MFKYFLLVSVSFLSLGVTDVYSKGTRASLETTEQWQAYCTRKIQQHRGQTKQNFYAALLSAFKNDGEFLPPISARDKKSEARKSIREKYDQQTVAHILSETQTTNSPSVITDVYELATAYRHRDQGRIKGLT